MLYGTLHQKQEFGGFSSPRVGEGVFMKNNDVLYLFY